MEYVRFIVEVEDGVYVKNGKSDTTDIREAKRFKSLGYLRTVASNYGIRIHRIIKDCGNGVYTTYDKEARKWQKTNLWKNIGWPQWIIRI